MQPTEKYYEHDAYRREAVGHILAAEPDSRTGGGRIALDSTVFYPEGGGQPADRGTLTLADGTVLTVTDVHEQAGVIWHMVTSLPAGAVPGAEAAQAIDWEWRFDKMQQHTGEHILSGILHSMFGAENVGFHIGSDAVRMDTNIPISAEGLKAAETAANRIIWENVPVNITYPTREELAALTYRSKKEIEGQVRIVTIPGADVCACCGTHVLRSGQVGIIKILSCQKFRSGVRMEILCGERAYRYLSGTYDQARAVGQQLSVKPLDAAAAVERLEAELTAAKARMTELEETVFFHKAQELRGKGDVLLVESPMRSDGVRKLADAVAKTCGGLAAVFSGRDGQFSYALVRADGTDVAPLVKTLNNALHGRGGGRGGFAQGSVQASEAEIRTFFNNPS